jgi:hypothetical protein
VNLIKAHHIIYINIRMKPPLYNSFMLMKKIFKKKAFLIYLSLVHFCGNLYIFFCIKIPYFIDLVSLDELLDRFWWGNHKQNYHEFSHGCILLLLDQQVIVFLNKTLCLDMNFLFSKEYTFFRFVRCPLILSQVF